MRIARFSLNGEPKFGIVDGPELVVLNGHPLVQGYDTTGERVPLKDVKLLAPTIPSKIVCIGKNYADHVAEFDGVPVDEARVVQEIRNTRPLSVLMAEQVNALRDWARSRTVPAD